MTPYYADDSVSLYHGDCLEADVWLAADVLVTDPPYGMGYVQWNTNTAPIAGDPMSKSRSADRVMTESDVALRDAAVTAWGSRPFAIFGSWRAPKPKATSMRLVWDKVHLSPGGVGVFKHSDEEIYLGHWPNPRGLAGKYGSILRQPSLRGAVRPNHPTPKPVVLMGFLISEAPAGVIADPFAGSGSTLLAARANGRKAIGVELEERYCELIASRLSQGDLFGGVA